MRVVADTHALVWYAEDSPQLSPRAAAVLAQAEADEGIAVSVASLVDPWYVTRTTGGVGTDVLDRLVALAADPGTGVELVPVDLGVFRAFERIDRAVLRDPWDRLIVATASALGLPLVTRDEAIAAAGLVPVAW